MGLKADILRTDMSVRVLRIRVLMYLECAFFYHVVVLTVPNRSTKEDVY